MTLTIDDILDHPAGSNVVQTPECGTCGRRLNEVAPGIFSHKARVQDWDRLQRERAKRERQARADALVPYTGAISQCQADVLLDDRGSIHGRCNRKPKWVVRSRYMGAGLMAVCTQHGKAQSPARYTGSGPFDRNPRTASEPIEKEFTDAVE